MTVNVNGNGSTDLVAGIYSGSLNGWGDSGAKSTIDIDISRELNVITTSGSGVTNYAIGAGMNGNVGLSASAISATANKTYDKDGRGETYAATNASGSVNLTATNGNINLTATSANGNVYGFDSWDPVDNKLSGQAIYISATTQNGNAYGVKVNKEENSTNGVSNSYTSNYNEFKATSSSGEAYAIRAENGSKIDVISNAGKNTTGNRFESNDIAVKLTEGSVLNATGNTVIKGINSGLVVVGKGTSTTANGDENYQVTIDGDLYALTENGESIDLSNGASVHVTNNGITDNKAVVDGGSKFDVGGHLVTDVIDGASDHSVIEGTALTVANNSAVNVDGNVYLKATETGLDVSGSTVTVGGNEVNIITGGMAQDNYGINAVNASTINLTGTTYIEGATGVNAVDGSQFNVTGDTVITASDTGLYLKGTNNGDVQSDITGTLRAEVNANGATAITLEDTKSQVGKDEIFNSSDGNGLEIINSNNDVTGSVIGNAAGTAVKINDAESSLTVGGNIMVSGGQLGVLVDGGQLTVNGNSASSDANIITSSAGNALKVVEGTAKINAGNGVNSIAAGETYKDGYVYFTGTAINATNESNGADPDTSIADGGSKVDVLGSENNIGGTVRANGSDSIVNIGGTVAADGTLSSGADNWITSSAHGVSTSSNADVVATVYAQNQATVNIKAGDGQTNYIIAQAGRLENGGKDYDERAVWAQGGSKVNIEGETIIGASKSEQIGIDENGNPTNIDFENLQDNTGLGIAIAAGTGEISNETTLPSVPAGIGNSTVNLNYAGNSAIYGDIISAWNGLVNIKSDGADTTKLNVYGSALAGNGGVLNLDLGNGGVWYGRADDYGDAGSYDEDTNQYEGFYDPAFSNKVLEGGEVNLTMGDGSKWYVQGQSWITSINTEGANDTLIDLVSANTNHNETAHALTIGTLNGDTRFHMSLDANRDVSDMLYIKNANGSYQISLEDTVRADEIGANGLRFATVGAGSNVSFEVGSYDNGAFNVEYDVISETYSSTDEENKIYNSTEGGNASIEKPGSDSVDNFFNPDNTKNKKQLKAANKIMLLAEDSSVNSANNENTITEHTNFLLNGDVTKNLSDAGKTMLNMSRANYSNAIYMDRLNKRLGEARYINGEENEGMWVRIRHDRIGKEDAFRSQNTMYELGYDVKQECDNGERRVGFAVDYMHGDTGYSDVAGKGELDRYGLWLYDTWMGDKGHYVDYVAKWGHLDNDFEVYTMSEGKKVTGDYSNNVFSVSAEYGRKKDIGSDWYFEPQAQLQLARVTGADYTTSQGTKVSVDGINSLIGRAGFRIGKDFGEQKQSTVYIKADVLHEFLGDQDVSVMDDTTNGRYVGIGYENEGTWYDVGFGFATQTGKNSYAFMDFEKSFGHDNDETYQINAGVQWTF